MGIKKRWLVFLVVSCVFAAARPARAWKGYTHSWIAEQARLDAIDDGFVTIGGRSYRLPDRVVSALRDFPTYYHAGAIGPDGFPDIVYGQMIVHPGSGGTASTEAQQRVATTGKWLRHMLREAWADGTGPALAFTYGFLVHSAGDVWGHTLANDFAEGVFPPYLEAAQDSSKAGIIIRHIVAESYVTDATPGFDGDEARTTFDNPRTGGQDTSDDSTIGFGFDVPNDFLYRTLIDPAAGTPTGERGLLIDGFLDLRDGLDDLIVGIPCPLEEAIGAYDDTLAAIADLADCDCDWWVLCLNCAPEALEVVVDIIIDTGEAIGTFIITSIEDAVFLVWDAYLYAWMQDIDAGLRDWGDLGLGISRGLFDPQARRDVQNAECDCLIGCDEGSDFRAGCEADIGLYETMLGEYGTLHDFIYDHLLSMAGAPDIAVDLLEILGDIMSVVDSVMDELLGPLNPIRAGIDEIKDFVKGKILEALGEALGIDLEELQEIMADPARLMCLEEDEFELPLLGTATVRLFLPGSHDRLDAYVGLPPGHHVEGGGIGCGRLQDEAELSRENFAAAENSIILCKLAFLDSGGLNQVLTDLLGRQISVYAPEENVMTQGLALETWLLLIDGDHAWRGDGRARFCEAGSICPPNDCAADPCLPEPIVRPVDLNGGNGQFPIWSSCVLRPAFRMLFRDWESVGFPDLGDPLLADPADDPSAPTSALERTGVSYQDGPRLFIGSDNAFTQSAADGPIGKAFGDDEIALRRRISADPAAPGPWQDSGQGETFNLSGRDGRYLIEYQAADPCHGFDDEPAPAETVQAVEVWLDTEGPVAVCATPPFGLIYDTDDQPNADFVLDDGPNGSGTAESSATIDGHVTADGVAPLDNGSPIDMYLLYPGVRTVRIHAADNLGNEADSECAFELHATIESLIASLERARAEGAMSRPVHWSLNVKLLEAKKQKDEGKILPAINMVEAFVRELKAQRGKWIDPIVCDRLIAWGEDLAARETPMGGNVVYPMETAAW